VKHSGNVSVPVIVKNVLNSISLLKEMNSCELEIPIENKTRKIFPKFF